MFSYFICHISYAIWHMKYGIWHCSSVSLYVLRSMKRPGAHHHADNRDQAEQQKQRRRDQRDRNRELVIAGNKPLIRKSIPLPAQFEHEGDVLPDAQREHHYAEQHQGHAEIARRFASK